MSYWLVKQEPEDYGFSTFLKEGKTAWTGVRNFQARNFLREMKKGDKVLYYHSGEEKQVVGLCRVARAAYADPTAEEGDWSCVDVEAVKLLKRPVTLSTIKADPQLKNLLLVRHSRLSVMPVGEAEFQHLLTLAETKA